MSDTLDPRALKAARIAYQSAIPDGCWHSDGGETDAPIRAAIAAYLAAYPQPQAGEPVGYLVQGFDGGPFFAADREQYDRQGHAVIPVYASPQPANPAQVTDGPISQQEMVALFGSEMPIEAVTLLYEAPEGWTCSDLRRRLREIAAIGAGGQAVADSLWVPAKPEHAKIGWTYDFDQTERLSRAAEKATGYDATMEVVEFVMAEADRRHKSTLSQPHPADERVVEAHTGAWANVRVEDTGDGLIIHPDDAKEWDLVGDREYTGSFLPDGRFRIALSAKEAR